MKSLICRSKQSKEIEQNTDYLFENFFGTISKNITEEMICFQ